MVGSTNNISGEHSVSCLIGRVGIGGCVNNQIDLFLNLDGVIPFLALPLDKEMLLDICVVTDIIIHREILLYDNIEQWRMYFGES